MITEGASVGGGIIITTTIQDEAATRELTWLDRAQMVGLRAGEMVLKTEIQGKGKRAKAKSRDHGKIRFCPREANRRPSKVAARAFAAASARSVTATVAAVLALARRKLSSCVRSTMWTAPGASRCPR
jgi:hypothetical protein